MVPTQPACECYMPRFADDLLMSNCPMLIGGGCHEAMPALGLGLLQTRTAAHFFRRLTVIGPPINLFQPSFKAIEMHFTCDKVVSGTRLESAG